MSGMDFLSVAGKLWCLFDFLLTFTLKLSLGVCLIELFTKIPTPPPCLSARHSWWKLYPSTWTPSRLLVSQVCEIPIIGKLRTFSRSLKCRNLVIIGHGLSCFSGPRRWALSIGTPAAFHSNLSLISCLIFGSGWSHVSFVPCLGIPSKKR